MARHPITSAATLATLLAAPFAHAAPLTWDANGTGAGQTDGAGIWLVSDQWWNGAANQSWVAGSDAIIGSTGTGGATTAKLFVDVKVTQN